MIDLRKPLRAALASLWLTSTALAQVSGGSGVSSVTIIAGTNITISGTCNSSTSISCTINSSAGGSGTVISVGFTGGLISVGTPTTTPALTVAGTSGGIPYFSGAASWASSAVLATNLLMQGGGAGAAPNTFTLGGDCTLSSPNITCTSINGKAVTLGGPLTTTGAGTTTLAFAAAGVTYTFPAISSTLGTVTGVSGDGTTVNCSPTTGAVVCNTLAPAPISPATTQTQVIALVDTVVALSSVAPSQNFTRCSPFKVPVLQHWDELLMGVTTLGTGPITVALYTDAIDSTSHRHQPQALIANSTGSFTVTGTGLVTSAMGVSGTGIPIPAGLNWACTNDAAAADAVRYDAIGPTSTYFMNLLGAVQTVAVASLLGTSQIVSLRSNSTITSGTWNSAVGVTFLDDAQANPVNLGARIASVP